MNQIKTKEKGKTPCMHKKCRHTSTAWKQYTFTYGDLSDLMKMHRVNNFIEKVVEHTEDEVARLHATLLQLLITELTDVMKREHEAAEKCHICFIDFNGPKNKGKTGRCDQKR